MSLFEELKRRKVFRLIAAYLVESRQSADARRTANSLIVNAWRDVDNQEQSPLDSGLLIPNSRAPPQALGGEFLSQ